MKYCICLIILGFTQFQRVFSIYNNNTENFQSYTSNPFTNIRRKRAQADYTRWQANLESTQEEFIVKILDEDFTTSRTKPIVAVNILPVTKRQEKIIIGAAIVSTPTPQIQDKDILKDYTRFNPPTTGGISQINEEIFLAPVPRIKMVTNVLEPESREVTNKFAGRYGIERHSQRDDSPPASPQFLPRTPMLQVRQYAPVTPVAFTKLTLLNPLIHSNQELSVPTRTTMKPVRTSSKNLIFLSTRTQPNSELIRIDSSPEEKVYSPNHDLLTRSTYVSRKVPHRSSVAIKSDEFYGLLELDNKLDDIDNNKKINEKKDSETLYHSMFYNDEDNEDELKKTEQNSGDSYDDRNESGDGSVPDTESPLPTTQDFFSSEQLNDGLQNETTPFDHSYLDDDESDSGIIKTKKGLTKVEPKVLKLTKNKRKDRRNPICNLLKLRQLNFNSPRTLPEIIVQLKQWAENSPVVKWVDITRGNFTIMENPIYLIIVDDPSSGQIVSAKQTVMIVAGIQGRDQYAVAAAMYVLYQLIERSEAHVDLLKKYRFWIIPVFNPDGYDYSMTFPLRRSWIKNLRQSWDICKGRESCYACENYGLRCTIQSCCGVNLDRNFEYQWIPAEELRSEHPCGDLYAGTRQLSEPETRALTHFLHEQRTPLYTFIAFKEGDILGVLYPYSHTRKKRAFDQVYRQRASRAASAASSISGRPYVAGQTSEFLPLYAGGIEDWVDGHLGIDNTYTIMMFRHSDMYNSKLITERVVHEAYAAMDTLLLQSTEPLAPRAVILARTNTAVVLHYADATEPVHARIAVLVRLLSHGPGDGKNTVVFYWVSGSRRKSRTTSLLLSPGNGV